LSSVEKEFRGWNPEVLSGHSAPSPKGVFPVSGGRASSSASAGAGTQEDGTDLFVRSEEMERIENEARQAGFDAGYADGKRAALEEIEPLRDAFIAWAAQLPDFEMQRLRALEPALISLLETALRRMMGEDLARPETIKRLVDRLVMEYGGGRTADFLLSESDYRQLLSHDPEFKKELGARGVRLEIGPDLKDHRVELRFSDRIVSFDPEEAVSGFRTTLSRLPSGPPSDSPPSGGDSEGEKA